MLANKSNAEKERLLCSCHLRNIYGGGAQHNQAARQNFREFYMFFFPRRLMGNKLGIKYGDSKVAEVNNLPLRKGAGFKLSANVFVFTWII